MTKLPNGWVQTTLVEVVDVLDSMRVPVNAKDRAKRQGTTPYYGATGQVGWIDEPIFNEELLLLGEDGAPFLDPSKPKAYMISGPSWVNNHAHVLRARPVTTNRFLKFQLDHTDYRQFVNGTTRLKLTQASMGEMPVSLPPREDQKRIVAAIEEQFSRLDAAEESLHRARHNLERFRGSVLGAITASREAELGTVATEFRYGTSVKCSYDAPGIPVLRIPNVRDGRVNKIDLKRATDEVAETSLVADGDLLFVRTNGSRDLIGRVAAVDSAEGMAFASYLIRARPEPASLDPRYAVFALSRPASRRELESRAATTAGQYNLNLPALRTLPIPLPPLEEQRRIVAEVERQLSIVDAMEKTIDSALTRSAQLRRSILERAFRGALVPQDPADEPASLLLDRIHAERAVPTTRNKARAKGNA